MNEECNAPVNRDFLIFRDQFSCESSAVVEKHGATTPCILLKPLAEGSLVWTQELAVELG